MGFLYNKYVLAVLTIVAALIIAEIIVIGMPLMQSRGKISNSVIPEQVLGSSMYPTIQDGQTVYVDYNAYKSAEVKNNDIIVVLLNDKKYVKRVIAIPGDTVIFGEDGKIYLNEKKLDESYLEGDAFSPAQLKLLVTQLEYYNNIVPLNYYLALGDNRLSSYDSTEYGLLLKDHIQGKVFLKKV